MYLEYQIPDCSGCLLSIECLRGLAPVPRICRDQLQTLLENMDPRLNTKDGKAAYMSRVTVADTAFAS